MLILLRVTFGISRGFFHTNHFGAVGLNRIQYLVEDLAWLALTGIGYCLFDRSQHFEISRIGIERIMVLHSQLYTLGMSRAHVAKKTSGLSLAVCTMVCLSRSAQTSARSRKKPAEKC
jgi:hypothetical protein